MKAAHLKKDEKEMLVHICIIPLVIILKIRYLKRVLSNENS